MIEYTVIVNGDRQTWWLNGKRHREDGPAYVNGDYQAWYLNGKEVTEAEHAKRTRKQPSCHGKVVEIDGKSYRLEEV